MMDLKVLLCTMWFMLHCGDILCLLEKIEAGIFLVMNCAVLRNSGLISSWNVNKWAYYTAILHDMVK